jgi:hypothetical protein
MLNKFITFCFITLTLGFISPAANAADIPFLTWEHGKEQNIVLGGYVNQNSWSIKLVDKQNNELPFRKSITDKNGYVVYTINLPPNLPIGTYRVEAVSKSAQPTVVAGIQVVEQNYYEIIKVPIQLLFLLLVSIFFITTLSVVRVARYAKMSYLQNKSEVLLPPFFASFYRLRRNSVSSIRQSLFKHLVKKEGELLHKLNPKIWALIPIFSFTLGTFIGVSTNSTQGIPGISLTLFFIAALVGVLDPYSGFTAVIGFSFLQTLQGNISSVRAITALIAIAASWIAPGIISSLYRDMLDKEEFPSRIQKQIPSVIAATFGGAIFYSMHLLLSSLLDRVGPITNSRIDISLLIALAILIKGQYENRTDAKLLLEGSDVEVKSIHLSRVVSPVATGFLFLFFSSVSYSWTESSLFAVIAALLLTTPMLLLQVRFASPVIPFLGKIRRGILTEGLINTAIAVAAFTFIQILPFEVIQKGKLFIAAATIPLIIHAIFSSLYDTQERETVGKK